MKMKRTKRIFIFFIALTLFILSMSYAYAANYEVTINQDWAVHANNTLQIWSNVTNIGDYDLIDVAINMTYSPYVYFLGSTIENVSGDNTSWNISYLNTTGEMKWNLSMWFNLTGPVANGTETSNGINASWVYNSSLFNSSNITDEPVVSFSASKEANLSVIYWYNNETNFTVNVTNTGDFYLNWVQINDSNSSLITFVRSNITGNQTNQQFNITQIAPGSIGYLWVVMNMTTGSEWTNNTWLFNNVTINSNETTVDIPAYVQIPVGAYCSQIRVNYSVSRPTLSATAGTIFNIIGIMMLIGAIFLIVVVVQKWVQ